MKNPKVEVGDKIRITNSRLQNQVHIVIRTPPGKSCPEGAIWTQWEGGTGYLTDDVQFEILANKVPCTTWTDVQKTWVDAWVSDKVREITHSLKHNRRIIASMGQSNESELKKGTQEYKKRMHQIGQRMLKDLIVALQKLTQ